MINLLLYFIITVILLSLSCCKNSKNDDHANTGSRKENKDFIREIPQDEKGDSFFYTIFKDASAKLKLQDIDNGFDSLMLRIWYPERVQQYMVQIANTSGKWEAELYIYEESYSETEADRIRNVQIRKLQPKSGWAQFTDELFTLGITTLPDMESIPNYPGIGADGNGYHVEVATIDKYRFYSHSEIIDLDIDEAQKMVKIMNLLNYEFEIEGNWF